MIDKEIFNKIHNELEQGMGLRKCRKCGCMKDTLEQMLSTMSGIHNDSGVSLLQDTKNWLKEMESIQYSCLGCKYCFPAVAMNMMTEHFPSLTSNSPLHCNPADKDTSWPPLAGEYVVVGNAQNSPVAVSTLASIGLVEAIARIKPEGLCIIGKTETENIGIEKIIKNTITNPSIRFLIVAGKESEGHFSGKTLLALFANGVDERTKVAGSPGKRAILQNTTTSEVELFRKQIKVIDMIGCEDSKAISDKITELSKTVAADPKPLENAKTINLQSLSIAPVQKVIAEEPKSFKMDKAGYFVVIPSLKNKSITVEHYDYKNKLLHIVEGKDGPSLSMTIIKNGWITGLDHAAYLGRELSRAELSIQHNFQYVQDKARGKEDKGMKKIITWSAVVIGFLITIIWFYLMKNPMKGTPAKQESHAVVDIDKVVRDPSHYEGDLNIEGKVQTEDTGKGVFLLACGDGDEVIPVLYKGLMPAQKSSVIVYGKIQKQEDGRYIFRAEKVTQK